MQIPRGPIWSRRNASVLTTSQQVPHPTDSGPMSDRRRAEIEAKRAKLAEIRRARADRERQKETDNKRPEVRQHQPPSALRTDSPILRL